VRLERRRGLRSGRSDPSDHEPDPTRQPTDPPASKVYVRRAVVGAAVVVSCFAVGYWIAASALASDRSVEELTLAVVPDLTGLTVAEAAGRLGREGLSVAESGSIQHAAVATGRIVAQRPLPGQLARPSDTVRVTSSRGALSRVVPDLGGMPTAKAKLVLERLGFDVDVRTVEAGGSFTGVQSMAPPAGEAVRLPARIELLVAEGPQVVIVPELRGLHVDDVAATLGDLGLELGAIQFDPLAAEAPGRVIGQSPPAAFSLRGGSFVAIVVAGPPAAVSIDREEPAVPVGDAPPDTTASG